METKLDKHYIKDIAQYKANAEELISYEGYYIQVFKDENELFFAYILNNFGIVIFELKKTYNTLDECIFAAKLLINNDIIPNKKEYDFSNGEKNPYIKK